jgi:tight adherence protein C
MPFIIAILTFAAVALGTWALLQPNPNIVARRIRGQSAAETGSQRRQESGIRVRVIAPAAYWLGAFLARLLPSAMVGHVERMLIVANSRMPVPIFLSIWAGSSALGVGLLVSLLHWSDGWTLTQTIANGVFVVGFFMLVPYLFLRRRVKKRQKSITRALPDALDLLVTGVESGLSVDAAFAMVTQKTSGPLSESFALYLRQVGLGRPRREAFLDVAERTGVTDLIRIAGSIAQAELIGAVLGDTLRMQAQDLRVLRRQRAQEAAQRAPVLMTIPLAICFLPAMGAVILVPTALNLVSFFTRQ